MGEDDNYVTFFYVHDDKRVPLAKITEVTPNCVPKDEDGMTLTLTGVTMTGFITNAKDWFHIITGFWPPRQFDRNRKLFGRR